MAAPPPTRLQGAQLAGPAPAEVITVTLGGRTFRAGRRTAAHLEWTIAELARLHPKARLYVIQPCYNTGVALSAYTHDYDGVLDVGITGLDWPDGQRFLRRCGWAAWWRHTGAWASPSRYHHHIVSLGCPGPVGLYVPGQVADYYNHALGLKGQHGVGSDPTWHPDNIDATVFSYPTWVAESEDLMPWTDWPEADQRQAARAIAAEVAPVVVAQLMGAAIDSSGTTVRAALRRAAAVPKLVRQLGRMATLNSSSRREAEVQLVAAVAEAELDPDTAEV